MTTLRNGAESGTADGTTVSAANSAGGPDSGFDAVTIGGADTLTFSSTQVAHAGHSYRWVPANASTRTFVRWSTSEGAQSTIYGRLYLWTASNPVTNAIAFFNALSSVTARCRIRLTTAGKIAVVNAAGTVLATSTNSITLSAWNRIEFGFTFSSSVGTYTVSLFAADSTSPVETLAGSAANFGGTSADTFEFITGLAANYGSSARTYYFDDLQLNTVALPGPAGITGSAIAALGGLSVSTSGTPTVTGSVAATLGALTVTTSGTRSTTGTTAAALGSLTAAVSGTPNVLGTITATLGALTASAAGVRATPGAATAPLGDLTITVTGAPTVSATVTTILGNLAVSTVGTSAALGTVTAALGLVDVHVAGIPTSSGATAIILGPLNVDANGTISPTVSATVIAALGLVTAIISGTGYPVAVRRVAVTVTVTIRERRVHVNIEDRALTATTRDRKLSTSTTERPMSASVTERRTLVAADEVLELLRSSP